jgi:WD40 repeat protein
MAVSSCHLLLAAALFLGGLGLAPTEALTDGPAPVAENDDQGKPSARKQSLDLHGDPLPPGAIARLGTIQLRHAGPYSTSIPLAFSADGKTLISASGGDRKLRWWDVTTGKQKAVRTLQPFEERYWPFVVLSGDGGTLAARVVRTGVSILKINSADGPRRIADDSSLNEPIALSANGRLLALGSLDGKIHLWDLTADRERILPIRVRSSEFMFSADAKYLAAVADNAVIVLEVGTGKEVRRFPARTWASVPSVAFSPDNRIVAVWRPADVQGGGTVTLYEIETGRAVREFAPVSYPVLFSPDGKLLATGGSDRIRLWDVKTGKELPTRHRPRGSSFAFSPDGKSLAFRFGAAIHVWNIEADRLTNRTEGHQGEVRHLAFSPDGKWLASAEWDAIRLWQVASAKPVREISRSEVFLLAFSPDGKTLLSHGPKGGVRRWNASTGDELPRYSAFELNAPSRGPYVLLAKDGTKSGGPRVLLSHDGSMLLTLMYNSGPHWNVVKVFDQESGKELWRGEQATALPELVSRDGKMRFSTTLSALAPPHGSPRALKLSADGRVLTVAFWGETPRRDLAPGERPGLDVWETATGARIRKVPTSNLSYRVALSRTGRYLAAAGLDVLHVFDLASGKEIVRRPAPEQFQNLSGGDPFASSLAFAPDSKTLATGLADGTILLWNVFPETLSTPVEQITSQDLDRLWSDLAEEASSGCVAMWRLAEASDAALPYLKKRLRPASSLDPQQIERLIVDLGSDRFAVRDKANRDLRALGEGIEPFLQKTLEKSNSLEFRRRAEALLSALQTSSPPNILRSIRAIAVLEHLGTAEATDILESLARGEPSARETWEADRAVVRLRHALHREHE